MNGRMNGRMTGRMTGPRRRLRTRLFVAMVALALGVLVLSALGAAGLARDTAANSALDELRQDAPRISETLELVAARFRQAAREDPSATRQASLALSCRLIGGAVNISGGTILVLTEAGEFEDGLSGLLGTGCAGQIDIPGLAPDLRVADLDVTRLGASKTQSGVRDGTAFVATPLAEIGPRRPVLVLSQEFETRPLGQAGRYLLWTGAFALLVAAFIAALLARRMTRPIAAMQATAGRIAAGDLDARVDAGKMADDELASLARSIDAMAADLGSARDHEHEFLLGISHDLRTPLTSIRGYAEAIADGTIATPSERARAAEVITSESRRLERLVADLLDLARLDAREFSMRPAMVDAATVVRAVVDGLAPTAAQWDVRMEVVETDEATVELDPERLAQVVANLLENALKHAASVVHASAAIEGSALVVRVDDDGPGIPAEERERIFDRLYTGRGTPSRKIGTGIGLAIVRELTSAMGGDVSCEPREVSGTRFVVMIPAGPGDAPAPHRPPNED